MLPMTATYSTVIGPHWQELRNLSTALTHPNGNITVEVILFVNVSLSFGWTKSIKLRPCHISFGNPKTSVIEVVVCNTIPSLRLTAAQKPPIPVDNCSLSKTSVIWYLVASPAWPRNIHLKFIYSEKSTKFCKTSTVNLFYVKVRSNWKLIGVP